MANNLKVNMGLDNSSFLKGVLASAAAFKSYTSGLSRGFRESSSEFSSFANVIKTGTDAISSQLIKMVATSGGTNREIAAAVDNANQLQSVVGRYGASAPDLMSIADSLIDISEGVVRGRPGMEKYVEIFKVLGLSAEELSNASPEKTLQMIADTIAKGTTEYDKQVIAVKLLGTKLLPEQLRAMEKISKLGLDNLKDLSPDYAPPGDRAIEQREIEKRRQLAGGGVGGALKRVGGFLGHQFNRGRDLFSRAQFDAASALKDSINNRDEDESLFSAIKKGLVDIKENTINDLKTGKDVLQVMNEQMDNGKDGMQRQIEKDEEIVEKLDAIKTNTKSAADLLNTESIDNFRVETPMERLKRHYRSGPMRDSMGLSTEMGNVVMVHIDDDSIIKLKSDFNKNKHDDSED